MTIPAMRYIGLEIERPLSSELGFCDVYGLTRIFPPLSTCHSVIVHAHSVDAEA